MALKRYTITKANSKTDYIFDANKITYIMNPDYLNPVLNFDYLNRLNLYFDNTSQAIDWINENILVPTSVCEYQCT